MRLEVDGHGRYFHRLVARKRALRMQYRPSPLRGIPNERPMHPIHVPCRCGADVDFVAGDGAKARASEHVSEGLTKLPAALNHFGKPCKGL